MGRTHCQVGSEPLLAHVRGSLLHVLVELVAVIRESRPVRPYFSGRSPVECRPSPNRVQRCSHGRRHFSTDTLNVNEPVTVLAVLTLELAVVARVARRTV